MTSDPFTGILATQQAMLSHVLLAHVPGAGLPPDVGIVVHDLGSKEIRARFDASMTDSALTASSYILTLSSGGPGVVPTITSVEWYDADHRSVRITLSQALTRDETYACQILNVYAEDGRVVTGVAHEFVANAYDPPQVVGAVLSLRGHVDVMFDRAVGQYSTSAAADLLSSAGGPGTPMSLVPWTSDIPENSVRFSFGSAPVATSYVVSYSGITDTSYNTTSGVVALELGYPVTGYSDLVQAQIVDAYVVSTVNFEYVRTTNVRVFFNVPMDATDMINTSNWTVTQLGPHVNPDTVNVVTAPDATDLTTLNALLNDIKTVFNLHVAAYPNVHLIEDTWNVVTAPDAVDFPTAAALINDIQRKVLDHYAQRNIYWQPVHEYEDIQNTFIYSSIFILSFAIAKANEVKAAINAHVDEWYSIPFSSAYMWPCALGEIVNYATDGGAHFDVSDSRTWFVDLHVRTHVVSPDFPIVIQVSASSEDLGSTTNPATTGRAEARMLGVEPTLLSARVEDSKVSLRFDTSAIAVGPHSVRVVNSSGVEVPVKRIVPRATLPSATWALNDAVFAYQMHIVNNYGAMHTSPVYEDLINPTDYVTTADLADIIYRTNCLKDRINNHFGRSSFHDGTDKSIVDLPDASTLEEAVAVLDEIRRELIRHNSTGMNKDLGCFTDVPERFPGLHSDAGPWFVSAPLYNVIEIELEDMEDGKIHDVSLRIRSLWMNGALGNGYGGIHTVDWTTETFVVGRSMRPSLASALPRPGYDSNWAEFGFASDVVEVFFSKPMRVDELNVPNFPITGGAIIVQNARWSEPRLAIVNVANMREVPYLVDAQGLHDEIGNPIY